MGTNAHVWQEKCCIVCISELLCFLMSRVHATLNPSSSFFLHTVAHRSSRCYVTVFPYLWSSPEGNDRVMFIPRLDPIINHYLLWAKVTFLSPSMSCPPTSEESHTPFLVAWSREGGATCFLLPCDHDTVEGIFLATETRLNCDTQDGGEGLNHPWSLVLPCHFLQ